MGVVQLVDAEEQQRRKADADLLREYADKVERGEITNFVLAANNRDDYCFETIGSFRDRWHILGAIEYAKQAVHNCG